MSVWLARWYWLLGSILCFGMYLSSLALVALVGRALLEFLPPRIGSGILLAVTLFGVPGLVFYLIVTNPKLNSFVILCLDSREYWAARAHSVRSLLKFFARDFERPDESGDEPRAS